jgi:hypothetical protein
LFLPNAAVFTRKEEEDDDESLIFFMAEMYEDQQQPVEAANLDLFSLLTFLLGWLYTFSSPRKAIAAAIVQQ